MQDLSHKNAVFTGTYKSPMAHICSYCKAIQAISPKITHYSTCTQTEIRQITCYIYFCPYPHPTPLDSIRQVVVYIQQNSLDVSGMVLNALACFVVFHCLRFHGRPQGERSPAPTAEDPCGRAAAHLHQRQGNVQHADTEGGFIKPRIMA